ncbi:MAG: hypothetical protein Q9219_006744 [cf. Caloplaca sp. 3 TL-2023]
MFQRAKSAGVLDMAGMDQVKYLHFEPRRQGLATNNLNACTAVVVASSTGAILGHFPPRPPNAPIDEAVGDAYIQAKMNEIWILLQNHKQDLPTDGSTGLIAYAVYQGAIALPSQKAIIENCFRQWAISFRSVEYTASSSDYIPPYAPPSGKGSVMILHQNSKAYLFVEDKAQDVVPRTSSDTSIAESSKASQR